MRKGALTIIMNSFFSIKLFTLGLLFSASNSFAQNCNCDSLLKRQTFQVMKQVKNFNYFKFLNIQKKGIIKSISEKEKIIKLLTADSAWIPLSDHRDSATIIFLKLGVIAGREINLLDGVIIDSAKLAIITHEEALRLVKIQTNSQAVRRKYVAQNVDLGDEYFEVYFSFEGHIIMSPTVCRKSHCVLEDNIISYLIF